VTTRHPLRRAVPAALACACVCAAAAPSARAAERPPPPAVRAPSAILVEPATGDIVYQRNANARRPIASTTKLMTALLALERTSLDDVLTAAPYRASPVESVIGLRTGERMSVRDLMRGLLLASGNDAAVTLAVDVGGSRRAFVRLMNARARALGLASTHYSNPIGLDEAGNYSSASDLVKLTLILRKSAFFRETTDQPRVRLRTGSRFRAITNRNSLVRRVAFVNGVKTGHTRQAGYVLVGSATRNGVTLISAVLGDPTEAARDADTLTLLRYGLRRYRVVQAVTRGRELGRARLRYRDGEVALLAGATVRRTARRGERLAVRLVGAPDEVEGPLPAGARVGTVVVRQRGHAVARVPLVLGAEVQSASVFERLRDYAGRPLTLLLLAALAVCSLQLVLLRRRAVRRRGDGGQAEIA
jgi:D-alanyl-D-alanine carboxypeptidase (penicillin-binding protein 5/6)